MHEHVVVLPAEAPRRRELESRGWAVSARSWGAQLDTEFLNRGRLVGLVAARDENLRLRQLDERDVEAILKLDAATSHDYPGSVATQHEPLDAASATPTVTRVAFGILAPASDLVAMTFVDVDGRRAETDFTVVRRDWRGRKLSLAVKAASVLALSDTGVEIFRTGGSAGNEAIISANKTLGYVRDEEWVTLVEVPREQI